MFSDELDFGVWLTDRVKTKLAFEREKNNDRLEEFRVPGGTEGRSSKGTKQIQWNSVLHFYKPQLSLAARLGRLSLSDPAAAVKKSERLLASDGARGEACQPETAQGEGTCQPAAVRGEVTCLTAMARGKWLASQRRREGRTLASQRRREGKVLASQRWREGKGLPASDG